MTDDVLCLRVMQSADTDWYRVKSAPGASIAGRFFDVDDLLIQIGSDFIAGGMHQFFSDGFLFSDLRDHYLVLEERGLSPGQSMNSANVCEATRWHDRRHQSGSEGRCQ